jgi:hypothetical protein
MSALADNAQWLVGLLAALPFALVAAALALFAYCNLVIYLWQLPHALMLRPRQAGIALAAVSLPTLVVLALAIGHSHPPGLVFALAALVPWPTIRLAAWLAWRADTAEQRAQAADIRNEFIAERGTGKPVSHGASWPRYLFDAERARRREVYDAPPI